MSFDCHSFENDDSFIISLPISPKKHNKPLYKNQVLFIESILNKSYRNCQKYIILYPKNFFDEKWFRKNSGQLIFNKTGGVGVWFENPKGKALRIPREIPFSFGDSDTNNSLLRGPPGLDCSGILAKETSSLGPLGDSCLRYLLRVFTELCHH